MHKLTFFPLGNADCCRIDLQTGQKVLFDYANTRDPADKKDLRCDLEQELRDDLTAASRDYFDVVAFSHLDEDHYKGASEFFWLCHAKKYQGDGRIKINVMWVPAAAITETGLDNPEGRIIQAEARHRFKQGHGIRVFSRPEKLRDWCKSNGVDFDKRKHLITDAGNLTPEFTKSSDGVEFFVHSPFAKRLNEDDVEDRNQDSIVMHATFVADGIETRILLMADCPHEIIADIVDITKAKKRLERLNWDVVKLPHHCSYCSLGPEKGVDKTAPIDQVKELFEDYRAEGGIIVSTSKPIPVKGSEEDKDKNPPHRQAANYYKEDAVESPADEFKVTMEHPKVSAPKALIIEIDRSKATVVKRAAILGAPAVAASAPRAG
ncbi:MAG: hypothetical protein GX575_31795 [Candidatus Anammoximicrobium sp.]|nr:hypothetical protein [Candidatus Anammoximicrobium sp.]